jgi:hypothetical protein
MRIINPSIPMNKRHRTKSFFFLFVDSLRKRNRLSAIG